MSDYYVVESQSLSDVADAIRAKTGGSADLEFPDEFVSEIASISGGGEDLIEKKINGTLTDIVTDLKGASYVGGALGGFKELVNARIMNIGNGEKTYFFDGCSALETVDISFSGNNGKLGGAAFRGCPALETLVLRNASGMWSLGCNSTNFNVIVLVNNNIVQAHNAGILNEAPAFKDGGTGGTIYIPKVLYDHLGDGTANDYKAATNWSTIISYGTITWAQIEGSYYETHYADGTVIPT